MEIEADCHCSEAAGRRVCRPPGDGQGIGAGWSDPQERIGEIDVDSNSCPAMMYPEGRVSGAGV